MVKQIVNVYRDDITGEEVAAEDLRTETIVHDGWLYRIDLGPSSYEKYMGCITQFLDHAEKIGRALKVPGRFGPPTAGRVVPVTDRAQRDHQRAWWRTNWERTVPQLPPPRERGRIPESVAAAYQVARGMNLPEGKPEPVKRRTTRRSTAL